MKRILVPCDFSAPAVQAYLTANNIAMKSNGEIYVIHAIDLPMMYETTYGIPPYVFDPSLLTTSEPVPAMSELSIRPGPPDPTAT